MTTRVDPPFWWALLQIAALCFHIPLGLLSGTQRAVSSPSSVLVVGLGVTIVFIALYLVLRIFVSGWRSLAVTSAGALLFWHASGLSSMWMLDVAFAALILIAAARFAEHRLFKLLTFVGSMTLGATLILLMALDIQATPEPVVEATDPIGAIELTSTPDIYLLLLDGYGRGDVLETRYGFDNSAFLDVLKSEGFDVADASNTNYTITHLSLPSMLEMSYMNEPGAYMHNSDLVALAEVASGENAFVRILHEAGYEYIHGDSDHWFNTCGPQVDVCLSGPLLDVTGHALLASTPIGGLFYPESGDPTTALNLSRIEQLTHWSEYRPETDSPTFTFLHLVLPHPPLYLDATCGVRPADGLGGRILNVDPADSSGLDMRKEAWVEQVECANRTVTAFLDEVDEDAIVVVVSDHGPDSEFVIETSDPADLTQAALSERLPNLSAVRLPGTCRGSLPRDVHLVNVLRVVLSCISDTEIQTLADRYYAASFGGSIVELKYSDPIAD